MPIIKPINYSCKDCSWSAVKMKGDVLLTSPGSSKCPSCGGELDEKQGRFIDLLNPVKRLRGLRMEYQEIRKT
ncbi:MAG: hypothetical protein H8E26_07480 [FCB group bacterium]|nr:hypothetical protein [FCB group bacterium]MBL7123243.1 hypothetical protein [Candidatus Neomarinimicrobiota bacterium]